MTPTDDSGEYERPDAEVLSRGELQTRAIRGAAWTIVHIAVSLPLAFGVNIVIARVLGVLDYGRLAYLTTIMDIVGGIISLGVGTALVQFGSKAHAAGRFDDVGRLLSATQGFRLLVSAPVLMVTVLVITDVPIPLLLVALVFGILLPSALDGAPACFGIENKTAAGARNAMLVNVLTQAGVLLAVFRFGTADSIWVARLVVGGLGVVLTLGFISPQYRRAILRPRLPRRLPDGFWRFALPAGAAGLIGTLVVSRTEVVILTWMRATEAAGVFALAFGLANHLFSPAQALIGPLVPAVSGLREVDEGAVSRALSRTLRAGSTVVSLLVGGALPAFAALVPLIYGSTYSAVPPVMLSLGIAGGFLVVSGPVQAFVQARLAGMRLLRINLLALTVDVALAVALIPLIGVWGAVIANVAAASLQLGVLLYGEVRALGIPWRETADSLRPTFVGIVACLTGWFTATALGLSGIATSVTAGLIGLLAAIVGLRLARTGLDPSDTEAIRRSLPNAIARLAHPLLALCTQRARST